MSSFQKRKTTPLLRGAKQSLHNGQPLVSTGNSALDHILGGGLPIGSILLIEEDKMVRYSEYLTKFYLSEGSVHDHAIFFANLDTNPSDMLKKLPAIVEDTGSSATTKSSTQPQSHNDMRIAWRYNNLEKIDSEQGGGSQVDGKNNYYFDLSQQIARETLDKLDVTTFTDDSTSIPAQTDNQLFSNQIFATLLASLKSKTAEDRFRSDPSTNSIDQSLLRIAIQSLGSPLWWNEHFSADLCLFLTILKSLVRHSLSVCCITVPTHLFKHFDDQLVYRVRNLVDYSIELESFAGSDKEANAVFKEYHGLLYIRKLAALNALATHTPETYDLAFKLRRKRFVIEKLHLPPELQESEQREQDDDSNILSAMGCGSASKHLLEF